MENYIWTSFLNLTILVWAHEKELKCNLKQKVLAKNCRLLWNWKYLKQTEKTDMKIKSLFQPWSDLEETSPWTRRHSGVISQTDLILTHWTFLSNIYHITYLLISHAALSVTLFLSHWDSWTYFTCLYFQIRETSSSSLSSRTHEKWLSPSSNFLPRQFIWLNTNDNKIWTNSEGHKGFYCKACRFKIDKTEILSAHDSCCTTVYFWNHYRS